MLERWRYVAKPEVVPAIRSYAKYITVLIQFQSCNYHSVYKYFNCLFIGMIPAYFWLSNRYLVILNPTIRVYFSLKTSVCAVSTHLRIGGWSVLFTQRPNYFAPVRKIFGWIVALAITARASFFARKKFSGWPFNLSTLCITESGWKDYPTHHPGFATSMKTLCTVTAWHARWSPKTKVKALVVCSWWKAPTRVAICSIKLYAVNRTAPALLQKARQTILQQNATGCFWNSKSAERRKVRPWGKCSIVSWRTCTRRNCPLHTWTK